ncbi:MAG: tRNA (guanosine(46)-N7)-methyltransferase TrmB [Muribaculaceae bacterium]|nr:tRNA (guanosine(46)-N7)-methyltransferase TrmB [Muribaculaceae bacterium]
MGKNKLKKFRDMDTFDCVFQYPYATLVATGFPLKGKWHTDFFGNDRPIVVELGCGKGEYTVSLARRYADRNFIGIDIKGARMWTGASEATRDNLKNLAFLRTSIELLPHFFADGEIGEFWITFPDPQMKKTSKRLTSKRFLELYRQTIGDSAVVNLKTDSPFLYTYTSRLVEANGLEILADSPDLYNSGIADDILSIRTFYEQQWLDRGMTIKYLRFVLDKATPLEEVDDSDIERDNYRSFSRGQLQQPELFKENI